MRKKHKIEEIHGKHVVELLPVSNYKSHQARIYCKTCDTWLNWASKDAYLYWCKSNIKSMELTDFYDSFHIYGTKTPKPDLIYIPRNEVVVWLNVPYQLKDYAKSHGAMWSPGRKTWYSHTGNKNIEKLMTFVDVSQIAEIYEHINNKGNDNAYYDK